MDLHGNNIAILIVINIKTYFIYRIKLNILTVICFTTFAVVYLTNSEGSIGDNDITGRVQFLLSFVLAGYVTNFISRWDRFRHTYVGGLWGSLENIVMLSHSMLQNNTEQDILLNDTIHRYVLSIFRLLFLAGQNNNNLIPLVEDLHLLTNEEIKILQETGMGTRPLVVIGWLGKIFELMNNAGYNDYMIQSQLTNALLSAKGAIGGTLGFLGTPMPFMYTHLVYWIIQMMLFLLAIATGVNLAVMYNRKNNGDENYSYDDDSKHWPVNSNKYYANYFLQQTAGNMIFAIFVEGLLFFCGKIENPLSDDETAFPAECYFVFLHNNLNALKIGKESFTKLNFPILKQNPLGNNSNNNNCNMEILQILKDKNNFNINNLINGVVNTSTNKDTISVSATTTNLNEKYSPSDVKNMLIQYGNGLEKYANEFEVRNITGMLFMSLTEEDLEHDFHVHDKYHRRAIMLLIKNIMR
jgi:predicted membrane chloride channel (bestrophin family)